MMSLGVVLGLRGLAGDGAGRLLLSVAPGEVGVSGERSYGSVLGMPGRIASVVLCVAEVALRGSGVVWEGGREGKASIAAEVAGCCLGVVLGSLEEVGGEVGGESLSLAAATSRKVMPGMREGEFWGELGFSVGAGGIKMSLSSCRI